MVPFNRFHSLKLLKSTGSKHLKRFRISGFTLIEMLVAIAILSVMGAVGVAALRGFSHSLRVTRVNEDELRNLRWFFETMDMELSSAILYRDSRFTIFKSERKDVGGVEVSNLRFTFIMPQRYLELGKRGEIVIAEYSVEKESEGEGFELIKKTTFNSYFPSENARVEINVLLGNIKLFELSFRDGGKWVEEWDSKLRRDVPDSVELKIQVGSKKYVEYFNIFPSAL